MGIRSRRVYVLQTALRDYRVEVYNKLSEMSDLTLGAVDKTVSRSLNSRVDFHPLKEERYRFLPFTFLKGIEFLDLMKAQDVLLMNSNPRCMSNFLAYRKARSVGAHVVFWNHGHTAGSPLWRSRLRYLLERFADRNLLYYEEEKPYAERLGIAPSNLFAAGNTIDTEAVRLAESLWNSDRIREFREREGLVGKKIVLYLGRITKKANVPLLVESFLIARRKNPDLVLVVIGGTMDELLENSDGVSRSDQGVRCLGALYNEDQLAPWFLASNVFFYAGSVGLSLIHAFAYGLPAVVHDDFQHHMPESNLMRDGMTGYTFERGSADDAASKILKLVEGAKEVEHMRAYTQRLVHHEYSLQNMANNIQRAIDFS